MTATATTKVPVGLHSVQLCIVFRPYLLNLSVTGVLLHAQWIRRSYECKLFNSLGIKVYQQFCCYIISMVDPFSYSAALSSDR